MSGKINIDEIKLMYERLKPEYEALAKEVTFAIDLRLKGQNIKIASLIERVKKTDSFLNKTDRKQYNEPLKQINDLAGVRVVCLYEPDINKIAQIIRNEFKVIEEISKIDELGLDRMGYQDLSFVIELGDKYSGARYEKIIGFKCEIQVRTVLQDAWSLISHHLVYKNEASVPSKLRRDLNSVSNLLEIAQGIFENIREKIEGYIHEIEDKRTIESSFLGQQVDFHTLAAYCQLKYPLLSISENFLNQIIADLKLSKYETLQQIDKVIENAAPAVEAYSKENPDFFKFSTDFLSKSLGFIDMEFRNKHGFAKKTLEAFEKYKNLVINQTS